MVYHDVAICLLAGGQARRMGGGDKGQILINGQTIISQLLARYQDAAYLFLNANGDKGRFAQYGIPVIADFLPDYQGPLCGIYSAMAHLRQVQPEIKWLVSLPTDAPFLPENLIDDFTDAVSEGEQIISVRSHGRRHPVIAMWSVSLIDDLRVALLEEGVRKIDAFSHRYHHLYLDYDDVPDPFLNLNRPEDIETLVRSQDLEIDLAFLPQSE